MNIFQLSISTLVFGMTLLLGTTAVIASRFVITTVASLTKPVPVPERTVVPAAEPQRVVDLPDLRTEPPSVPDEFDPSGSYFLETEKAQKAFTDIDVLEIETRSYLLNENDMIYTSIQIVPTGSLNTSRRFEFTRMAVNNREISFETNTNNGISYQFVGNFPVSAEYISCLRSECPGDLEGKLKKLKNGRMVAEMDAKFFIGGC